MTTFATLSDAVVINPRIPKALPDDAEVSFLAMASVSEDGHVLVEETKTFGEVKKGYTYFERNDVLVAKITPCFENGKAIYLDKLEHKVGFGSTEFHVLRTDPKVLVGKYLFYLLWNPAFRRAGEASMTGSAGQRRVPADFLRKVKIPIPPLSEQERIVAILDKADIIRRKRQKAMQLADQFLRAVFLDIFGDPVSNSKGWDVVSLKDLTHKIGSGATPKGGNSAYVDEGISLIRSMNVHDDKFVHNDLAHLTESQANALNNVVVEQEDVLLNITGASVCRCAMVDHDVLPARVNQHVCIIRPRKSVLISDYLVHLIISSSFKRKLLMMAGGAGATREALTKQQIEGLEIPLPPVNLQKRFADINKRIKSMVRQHYKLMDEPLFDALSQKAFAGEL